MKHELAPAWGRPGRAPDRPRPTVCEPLRDRAISAFVDRIAPRLVLAKVSHSIRQAWPRREILSASAPRGAPTADRSRRNRAQDARCSRARELGCPLRCDTPSRGARLDRGLANIDPIDIITCARPRSRRGGCLLLRLKVTLANSSPAFGLVGLKRWRPRDACTDLRRGLRRAGSQRDRAPDTRPFRGGRTDPAPGRPTDRSAGAAPGRRRHRTHLCLGSGDRAQLDPSARDLTALTCRDRMCSPVDWRRLERTRMRERRRDDTCAASKGVRSSVVSHVSATRRGRSR